MEMYEELKNLCLKVTPFHINPPRRNKPIQLLPIKKLTEPKALPIQLLEKIGVKKEEHKQNIGQSWLQSILPSCSACSCIAQSRQTLHQLDSHNFTIQNKQNQHLQEQQKRIVYKKIFQTKTSALQQSKKLKIFEQLYIKHGGKDEQTWINEITKYNKKV